MSYNRGKQYVDPDLRVDLKNTVSISHGVNTLSAIGRKCPSNVHR